MFLAIFSPIFVLYPVAEIEVLGRKELIIFLIFLSYLLFDKFKNQIYVNIIPIISILTWEPVFIFFQVGNFIFLIDLFFLMFKEGIKFDKKFLLYF